MVSGGEWCVWCVQSLYPPPPPPPPTSHHSYEPSLSLSLPCWWLAFRRYGGVAIWDFHCDGGTGGGVLPRCSLHHLTFYNEQTCICIRANQPEDGMNFTKGCTSSDWAIHSILFMFSFIHFTVWNAGWRILQKCEFFNFCIKIVWTITLTAIWVFVRGSLRT